MIFLHCWKCRLISTPSGRRLQAFPGARGDAIAKVCALAQDELKRRVACAPTRTDWQQSVDANTYRCWKANVGADAKPLTWDAIARMMNHGRTQ